MAVLIEAISVVILRSRIVEVWRGGWDGFVADCPNQTLCADRDLARVGFMNPNDVEPYVGDLQRRGLVFRRGDGAVDIVVVDQMRGPTTSCDWVEFGRVEIGGHPVAACRLAGSDEHTVVTPPGWRFEGSLSATFGFVPTGLEDNSLRFLRHEDGVEVYLNLLTGKEVFVGRTKSR